MKNLIVFFLTIIFSSSSFAQIKFYEDFEYLTEKEIDSIDRDINKLIKHKQAKFRFTSSLGVIQIEKKKMIFEVTLDGQEMRVISVKIKKLSLLFELLYQGTECKLWLPRAEEKKRKNRRALKYDYWVYFNVPNAPYLEVHPITSVSHKSEAFVFFDDAGGFFYDWELHSHQFVSFTRRFRIYLDWCQALWEAETLFYCQWNDSGGKGRGTHLLLFGFREHWGLYRWTSPVLRKKENPSLVFFLKPSEWGKK